MDGCPKHETRLLPGGYEVYLIQMPSESGWRINCVAKTSLVFDPMAGRATHIWSTPTLRVEDAGWEDKLYATIDEACAFATPLRIQEALVKASEKRATSVS